MTLRRVHLWLGVFFAPTILLFSITGLIQVTGFHEAQRGSDYRPPDLIVRLSQAHIHQRFAPPPERPGRARPARAEAAHDADEHHDGAEAPRARATPPADPPQRTALKAFFLLTALALTLSTLLGLWIAFTQPRGRRTSLILLLIGTLIPVVLLAL